MVVVVANHPSAYGGYPLWEHMLEAGIESSLPIWRVRTDYGTEAFTGGIIPPHMEGTICLHQLAPRIQNHPSAYGGYRDARRDGPGALESSLRIRRVRYAALLVCECYENHPSAYGGYDFLMSLIPSRWESSLRIRRVHTDSIPSCSVSRIIPPHTEGTYTSGAFCHVAPNHPSAYGGYLP